MVPHIPNKEVLLIHHRVALVLHIHLKVVPHILLKVVPHILLKEVPLIHQQVVYHLQLMQNTLPLLQGHTLLNSLILPLIQQQVVGPLIRPLKLGGIHLLIQLIHSQVILHILPQQQMMRHLLCLLHLRMMLLQVEGMRVVLKEAQVEVEVVSK